MLHFSKNNVLAINRGGYIEDTETCPCSTMIAVEDSGAASYSSKDGISWKRTINNSGLYGKKIATNGDYYVVGGDGNNYAFIKTIDGSTWYGSSTGTGRGRALAWNGSYWLSAGLRDSGKSEDAETWQTSQFPQSFFGANSLAWNGSKWVVVSGGIIGSNKVVISTDGINWTGYDTTLSQGLIDIVWNGSYFLASDGFRLYKSNNGINWGDPHNAGFNISDFAWNGFLWVIVGLNVSSPLNGVVATSLDGENVTNRYTNFTDRVGCVAWNGTIFVVLAESSKKMVTSVDGINWIENEIDAIGRTFTSVATIPAPNLYPPIG